MEIIHTREQLLELRKYLKRYLSVDDSRRVSLDDILIEYPDMLGVVNKVDDRYKHYELLSEGYGAFGEPENSYWNFVKCKNGEKIAGGHKYYFVDKDLVPIGGTNYDFKEMIESIKDMIGSDFDNKFKI